jgi:hypothetical protein
MALVQKSLQRLGRLLSDLKFRTLTLINEYATGTYTARCSRSDLLSISGMLPQRGQSSDASFDDRKAEIMARFRLGSRQFSLALTKLQTCREMNAILGVETPLVHLSDADIEWIVSEWRHVHPKWDPSAKPEGLVFGDPDSLEQIREHLETDRAAVATIADHGGTARRS